MAKSKVTKASVYQKLSQIIEYASGGESKKFIDRFYVTEPEPGKRIILKNLGNNIVRYVDQQAVVSSLLSYIREFLAPSKELALTHHDAVECVKYWLNTTNVIDEPKFLGEKDDPSLCFTRLSFNYSDEPRDTLVLDELMGRCSNGDALKQYIGSLTIEDSSRFQYAWIYGSGGEGKGSLGRGLSSIFGSSCITMAVPRTDGQKQFLAHSLQGKRVCVFPECSNFAFPNDPLFKQMTGGDMVFFEQKGKMGFSGQLNTKFVFFSNDRPGIAGTDANLRRIIYSQISKPTVRYPSGIYDALIAQEMPSFIIKCRNLYLEKCPNNEDISFEDDTTKELIDDNEEQYEVLTDKWFIPDANGMITPARLREIQGLEKMDELKYRKWMEYMRLKLNIETKSKRTAKGIVRIWAGIRVRSDQEVAKWVLNKNTCNLVLLDRNTDCNIGK